MNYSLFMTLLALLGGFSLWLGRKGKDLETNDDFFLMGRKLGLFSLVMTLLATQVGGGALMGAAEEAYSKGWIVICYPLGMVAGMVLLGIGFGAKMRSLNISTVAELFEKIYGSLRMRKGASTLSIISLFFILVAQAIAARKFFMSIGFENDLLFVTFWMILVVYTVVGGLRAVVKTDILQASFILLAFFIACVAAKPIDTQTAISLPRESAPGSPG